MRCAGILSRKCEDRKRLCVQMDRPLEHLIKAYQEKNGKEFLEPSLGAPASPGREGGHSQGKGKNGEDSRDGKEGHLTCHGQGRYFGLM